MVNFEDQIYIILKVAQNYSMDSIDISGMTRFRYCGRDSRLGSEPQHAFAGQDQSSADGRLHIFQDDFSF